MPEPFLPQDMYYCCVQKNLIDFRAFCQDWAPLALGWDRIPSQAQVACFCRQQNTNIQLKLNIYCTFPLLVSVCVWEGGYWAPWWQLEGSSSCALPSH